MVALQPAGKVIPGGGDEGVFPLQVSDDLVALRLYALFTGSAMLIISLFFQFFSSIKSR